MDQDPNRYNVVSSGPKSMICLHTRPNTRTGPLKNVSYANAQDMKQEYIVAEVERTTSSTAGKIENTTSKNVIEKMPLLCFIYYDNFKL